MLMIVQFLLQPTVQNLRNTTDVLDFFFQLSGLKMSISKTKAIWFGSGLENQINLCPDLQLDWSSSFTLLGIDFENNLENMSNNFDKKIDVIKKLLNSWINRTLTIYGKIKPLPYQN